MVPDPIAATLGTPHHSAYVVESIERTVQELATRLGAGPFLLIENVPLEDVTSGGEPAVFAHSSAFGSSGGYPIELIEVERAAPERVASKLGAPFPRLHHVGYALAPEVAVSAREALGERGLEGYLSSRLNGEVTTVHDAATLVGHDIEILVDAPALRDFFSMVLGAADGWNGADPLRPLG